MDNSRRNFLGTAAVGVGGLVALTSAATAEGATDHGKPGEGGFGRQSAQLPPGATVAYHDPKDVARCRSSPARSTARQPKVTSGGWAKESTEHQLPIMTGLAGVHMFLNPGGSRELHWHAIAAEWAYVIAGRCQTVVLDPSGQTEVNNYVPGRPVVLPQGPWPLDPDDRRRALPLHPVVQQRRLLRARHVLDHRLDRRDAEGHAGGQFRPPPDAVRRVPEGRDLHPVRPGAAGAQAIDAPWPRESTHKFSLLKDVAVAAGLRRRHVQPGHAWTSGRSPRRCRAA